MVLKVAEEFSRTPGPRFDTEGPNSAENFRTTLLKPKFEEAEKSGQKLLVDLDGGFGYATSFLEEAFGGLARIYSPEKVEKVLDFKSDDEYYLPDDIRRYIREAKTGARASR